MSPSKPPPNPNAEELIANTRVWILSGDCQNHVSDIWTGVRYHIWEQESLLPSKWYKFTDKLPLFGALDEPNKIDLLKKIAQAKKNGFVVRWCYQYLDTTKFGHFWVIFYKPGYV